MTICVAGVRLLFMPYLGDGWSLDRVSAAARASVHRSAIGEIFPANPPAWSLFFEMVASIALSMLTRPFPSRRPLSDLLKSRRVGI
jgi:peptidoglycan/LPS O-acetylase OafA/YrhL